MKNLSKTERLVLFLLSRGASYKEVEDKLEITPENMHSVCAHIRVKTGIESTRSQIECRNYVRAHRQPVNPHNGEVKDPTPKQIEAMRLLASGLSYAAIAHTMNLGEQSVQNHIWSGCQRIGIRDRRGWERTCAIKQWFRERENPNQRPKNPMNDPAF